jgi:hypothetical protein
MTTFSGNRLTIYQPNSILDQNSLQDKKNCAYLGTA